MKVISFITLLVIFKQLKEKPIALDCFQIIRGHHWPLLVQQMEILKIKKLNSSYEVPINNYYLK